jgi:hypothetical protein
MQGLAHISLECHYYPALCIALSTQIAFLRTALMNSLTARPSFPIQSFDDIGVVLMMFLYETYIIMDLFCSVTVYCHNTVQWFTTAKHRTAPQHSDARPASTSQNYTEYTRLSANVVGDRRGVDLGLCPLENVTALTDWVPCAMDLTAPCVCLRA